MKDRYLQYKILSPFKGKKKRGENLLASMAQTSGKLHKIPQATYNLEPICGSVAETGDLTKPFEGKTISLF